MDDILAYHQASKHFPQRYARSLGFLDWASQPKPFLRYAGTTRHKLPLEAARTLVTYDSLFLPDGGTAPSLLSISSVSAFFRFSMGLSAWKEYGGNRWELRCNPSSGNLHPTEAFAILGPLPQLSSSGGVYHYSPLDHSLETRATIPSGLWTAFEERLPPSSFIAGLASIYWREAWKYGERAYRYCQHDVGHALAAMSFSAAALGWRIQVMSNLGDDDITAMLGLSPTADTPDEERLHPELLAIVYPRGDHEHISIISEDIVAQFACLSWSGRPERLSDRHVHWEAISQAALAAKKQRTAFGPPDLPENHLPHAERHLAAHPLFLQRRSALGFDGVSTLSREAFFQILWRALPQRSLLPWNANIPQVNVHFAIFVHRVAGLNPGLYFLLRDPRQEEMLRASCRNSFLWEHTATAPSRLPLYLLQEGDYRGASEAICCHQEIAADGVFCVAMISRFRPILQHSGAWLYPRLFWEAGMLGQVLYLEAEAVHARGTGIGCFFDDEMHRLLGIGTADYQSLYHFTLGTAVDDPRLRTLPAYQDTQPRL